MPPRAKERSKVTPAASGEPPERGECEGSGGSGVCGEYVPARWSHSRAPSPHSTRNGLMSYSVIGTRMVGIAPRKRGLAERLSLVRVVIARGGRRRWQMAASAMPA